MCLHYDAIIAVNLEESKKDRQRIPQIKPFIGNYNWKRINYPSGKDDKKMREKNNPTITLHVLYVNKMNIHSSYISIHNLNHENQIILLMIPNEEEWHYLAVKKLSPLLRGKT